MQISSRINGELNNCNPWKNIASKIAITSDTKRLHVSFKITRDLWQAFIELLRNTYNYQNFDKLNKVRMTCDLLHCPRKLSIICYMVI